MYIYIELYIYTYPVTVIITGIDGHNLRYNHRTSPRRWCPSFPAPKWSRWWPTLVKHRRRRMKGYRKVGEKWWQNARNPKFHLALAAQMHKWWLYHGFAQKNGDLLPFRHAFTKKANHFTIFSGVFPPKTMVPRAGPGNNHCGSSGRPHWSPTPVWSQVTSKRYAMPGVLAGPPYLEYGDLMEIQLKTIGI